VENAGDAVDIETLVDCVCSECGIPSFRQSMNDEEIAKICKWVGEHAPNSKSLDGKVIISAEGFDVMIFIAIIEFPQFYKKHQLSMVWRN